MNLDTQLSFHRKKKQEKRVRTLEITYNFLYRQYTGEFPFAVIEKYNKFCLSKNIPPKTPSIKTGYITDWSVYGQTMEKAIDVLQAKIDEIKENQKDEQKFFGKQSYKH